MKINNKFVQALPISNIREEIHALRIFESSFPFFNPFSSGKDQSFIPSEILTTAIAKINDILTNKDEFLHPRTELEKNVYEAFKDRLTEIRDQLATINPQDIVKINSCQERIDKIREIAKNFLYEKFNERGIVFQQTDSDYIEEVKEIVEGNTCLVCHHFAVIKIGGAQLYHDFYCGEDLSCEDALHCFLQMGYQLHTNEPRSGDLCVYGHKDKNKFSPLHFGIYQGNGKVLSKWSDKDIFEHHQDAVSSNFGNAVIFLRKP